jgi:hypothetical protein
MAAAGQLRAHLPHSLQSPETLRLNTGRAAARAKIAPEGHR